MSNIKLVHSGGNSVSLTTPDSNPAANRTFKLPGADGTANQALLTDGSGALSFGTPAVTTDNLKIAAYGSFDLTAGSNSFSSGDQMGPFDTIGTLVGITKGTGNSVANSRFTLPSAGLYSIQAKMYAYGNTNPASFGFRLLQNGTIISHFFEDTAGFLGSNGDYIHYNHYIGEFAANDYVELQAAGNLSSWNADQYYNRLTIYKVGTLT